jgi:nicotinamide-nucleotide amidase
VIAEIVSIGTELLLGQIANRDAQLLSQWLADLGFDVFWHVTVGDNLARAEEALRRAAERADVVITSGGLGPTYDDITREAVARAAGRPLVENEEALSQVEAWFRSRGIPFLDVNRRQALMPEGAVCLANPRGSAPGFWLPGQPIFVALPGPPRELEAMWRRAFAPFRRRRS